MTFEIDGRKIGKGYPPYIVAELSANHGGKIDVAKRSIKKAKQAGASAVKIQTYTPDTMTIKCDLPDFQIESGIWAGKSLYNLYEEAHTPFEWHEELFSFAREIDVTLFSTPFDETAVDLLENLNAPAFKIASFELIDHPLIQRVAKCGKPVLMSTGMASLEEIREAVETVRSVGNNQILLFHCVSSYPTPTKQMNLNNIPILAREFDVEVGLSDHSTNNLAATVSIALGAVAIEKHFKVSDQDHGPDSSFSILPDELADLVAETSEASEALGRNSFARASVESENARFRRSIYFVKPLKAGSFVSEIDIRRIRPGFGLAPKYFEEIVGKRLNRDVKAGEPVTWNCFDAVI